MPVLTARQSHNSEVLRDILELYAKPGARILDMTYGEGAFWRNIDVTKYELVTNDLHKDNPSGNHWNFGAYPPAEVRFDVVVFDLRTCMAVRAFTQASDGGMGSTSRSPHGESRKTTIS